MKKVIAFFKSLFIKSEETSKTYAEVKKEAKEQTEKIVADLDEVKASEAAPKKKKRYYKPKNKA